MKKRNGEIELLRFVFAVPIMIIHFRDVFSLGVFGEGRIGVEFFYMVTGILLAMSVRCVNIERKQIPSYTWKFIKNKIGGFFPYYIMAIILNEIFLNVLLRHNTFSDIIKNFILAIPRILFFDCFGFRTNSNFQLGIDWYLSAMISAIFILLPILLYNYELATKIIFPLISVVGLGTTFMTSGTISARAGLSDLLVDPLLIRAICYIALGAASCEIAQTIKAWNLTKLSVILLSMFKWVCFILVIVYMYFDVDKVYEIAPITLLLIGITLSFSENTYNIPYNTATKFFGKLSLPLYLSHIIVSGISSHLFHRDVEKWKVWVVIILTPFFAYVFMIITDFICKGMRRVKHLFINE